jgi:hypothetical protein
LQTSGHSRQRGTLAGTRSYYLNGALLQAAGHMINRAHLQGFSSNRKVGHRRYMRHTCDGHMYCTRQTGHTCKRKVTRSTRVLLRVASHSRKCGAHLQAVGHTGSSLYDANGAHWQTAGNTKCMDTLAGTDHTRHMGHTCGESSHEAHVTHRQQIIRPLGERRRHRSQERTGTQNHAVNLRMCIQY